VVTATKLGPTSWYYTVDQAMLKDDTVYTFEARSLDYAGNYSSVFSTYTVTYDITGPNININFPLDGVNYSHIKLSTPVAGTTANTQTSPNTGVSSVTVSIAELDVTGLCFNGTGFSAVCPYWLDYNGGTLANWTYNNSNLVFSNDRRYQISAKAYDIAGNSGPTASVTIKYDVEIPTSTINWPKPGYVVSFSSITGTATDERYGSRTYEAKLGTYTVKVALQRITAPSGWWSEVSGDFDSANPNWYEANNSTTTTPNQFVYNLSASLQTYLDNASNQNVQYRLVTWSYDLALNREYGPSSGEPQNSDVPTDVGVTIQHDNTRPTTLITMPNLPAHNTMPVINGTAEDNIGISDVRITVYNVDQGRYYDPSLNPPWSDIGSSEELAPWVPVSMTIYVTSASWSYAIGDSTWAASVNYTYRIRAKSKDVSGNWDITYSTAQFKYDNFAPISTVTFPSPNQHLNALPITLSGTSSDPNNGSGVNNIRYYFVRRVDNYYWSGASWESTPQPLLINPPYPSWTQALNSSAFSDGEIYDIYTRAQDEAGNYETGGFVHKVSFVYDVSNPTSSISYPYDSGYISQTGKPYGYAYDKPNGKVADVLVRVKQISGAYPGYYWNVAGTNWVSADTWNSVLSYGTLSPDATYWMVNTSPWQTGEIYEINVKAVDKAGNYQLVFATATNIKADFTAPTSTVTYPAHGSLIDTELTSVSGLASDEAPGVLDKVLISYFKCADVNCLSGNYWNRNSGAWDSATEIFYDAAINGSSWTATGISTPTWNPQASGTYYRIFAKAIDQAANAVIKPNNPGANLPYIQFQLKPPPPVSTIINPNSSIPHLKSSPSPVISGTAVYATTVAVKIIDFGPDLIEGSGMMIWRTMALHGLVQMSSMIL